jgi:hypothetical protein
MKPAAKAVVTQSNKKMDSESMHVHALESDRGVVKVLPSDWLELQAAASAALRVMTTNDHVTAMERLRVQSRLARAINNTIESDDLDGILGAGVRL